MPVSPPSGFQQKLIFWSALVLIVGASALSLVSTQRLVRLGQEVENSRQLMTDMHSLVSDLKDVETGARGYLLTGDNRFLRPFETGQIAFRQTLRRLESHLTEDVEARHMIGQLGELGEERMRLAQAVVARRGTAIVDPITLRFLDRGRETMDRIRRDTAAVLASKQATYTAQKRAVERQAQLTNAILIGGVALSLGALAWLFMVRNREVRRRRLAEGELRDLNAQLEARVEERTAEVRRSRELLDAVIENMPDTVFLKDADHGLRYVLINAAGERLLGRNRDDLLGHVDHELFPREQAAVCKAEDVNVRRTGKQAVIPEREIQTAEGTRLVESRKVPISDSDGHNRFILGIVRDVTERKSMEEQVRQMQRMDAVGRLTGGVAHDFNNLLAIILGNVEMIRDLEPDGSEAAEMADEALGAASRGAELVKRMLAFARMQKLEPSPVDLNERLPEITSLLRRTLGENISVQIQTDPGLWRAMIDPTQVDDALLNLAINARDAMPTGGTLSIETANKHLDEDYAAHHAEVEPGDYVMLAVSDTGSGMSSAVIARVFDPFFTTKEPGHGTGLGLSQVYGWVKQSGGHIKIYSEEGHGTSIKLYLPRHKEGEDEASAPPAEEVAGVGGTETVLVVEDNQNVRRVLMRQLGDLGYLAIEATDAADALNLIAGGAKFDLMLTDVVMPGGMNGYDLASEVRKSRPGTPVLFTSGYTELATGNGHAPHRGPLLSKPYRKQDLGRAIRALLDTRG